MLKDITLGQYFPGTSVIHRLDPRTKLLALIVYIVSLFMANNVLSYALCIAFLLTVLFLSRIQPKLVLKSLKPVKYLGWPLGPQSWEHTAPARPPAQPQTLQVTAKGLVKTPVTAASTGRPPRALMGGLLHDAPPRHTRESPPVGAATCPSSPIRGLATSCPVTGYRPSGRPAEARQKVLSTAHQAPSQALAGSREDRQSPGLD